MKIQRCALLSVYEKREEDICRFAEELVALGWQIIASPGTYAFLKNFSTVPKKALQSVERVTHFPPLLDHQVVTLHPAIHAGLLATPDQALFIQRMGWPYIDLLYSTLYPLEQTIQDPRMQPEDVRQQTDIGGPTALRAAAKGRKIIVTDKESATRTLEWLKRREPDSELFRLACAAGAERMAEQYSRISAEHLEALLNELPEKINVVDLFGDEMQPPKAGE